MDGNVLGGGFEIALGCDYRVAAPRRGWGCPRSSAGCCPAPAGRSVRRGWRARGGAGADPLRRSRRRRAGDQRSASSTSSPRATCSRPRVAFARTLANGARRRASELARTATTARSTPRARTRAARRARRPGGAPRDRLRRRRAARCRSPRALARERERFVELMRSEQSKARMHIFFAEREAAKLPDGSAPPPFAVRTAAVIGGGTMGTGIAMACANAGIAVRSSTSRRRSSSARAASSPATTRRRCAKASSRKKRWTRASGRIAYATSLDAAADVDLVIEAVFEEMGVKQDVFRQLDRDREARDDPRHQHVDARHRRDRRRDVAAAGCRRDCISSARRT